MRVSRRDLLRLGGLAVSWLGLEAATASLASASPSAPAAPDAGTAPAEAPTVSPVRTVRLPARPPMARGPALLTHDPDARDIVPRYQTLGRTRGGQALTMSQVGNGGQHLLLLGGQHGTPEANTVDLADGLLRYFLARPDEIPKGLTLDILTVTNPDGYIAGSRQYLTDVDPNRNWDSGDWETDAYDSLGHFRPGLGGPEPMSEPETRELAAWIVKYRPLLVINYHSAGGLISTRQNGVSADLGYLYAEAGDYPFYGPDDDAWWYPITGAMDGWLARMGIPDIFVELSNASTPEFEDNLAGVKAVLATYRPG